MRALLLPLASIPLLLGTQDRPGERPEPPKVRVQLLGEVDALSGGEEFFIGMRYSMAPHWHIYWKNPGDSGLPTTATLAAPEGFEVGPLLFPGPQRIELPGDITSFAYEDEVVLFWRVTAPADLGDAERFEFRAESEWLACEEICVRGDGASRLAIPRAKDATAVARDTDAFGSSFARLPRPLSSLKNAAASLSGTPDAPVLELEVPGKVRLDWFPESERDLELEREAAEAGDERAHLRRWYSFRPNEEGDAPRVRGLLSVEHEDATAFYEVDLSLQPTEETENR